MVIKRAAGAGALPLVLVATLTIAADSRVPYVPTPQGVVDRMLEIAKVGPTDYVIDLGSGDGRIVITAAKKHGARGFGVDLDPQRVKESLVNAKQAGVSDRALFYQRNLFETKIAEATVVTMYLLPSINVKLLPKLNRELKPGTRVVSQSFDLGGPKPKATIDVAGRPIYLWVVPIR